jgi:hypothetical protein
MTNLALSVAAFALVALSLMPSESVGETPSALPATRVGPHNCRVDKSCVDSLAACLSRTSRAEAFDLHWFHSGNLRVDDPSLTLGVLDGYGIKKLVAVTDSSRQALMAVLSSPGFHTWNAEMLYAICGPDVGFRFSGESDTVTVLFNRGERLWKFRLNGVPHFSHYEIDDAQLMRVLTELFPNDARFAVSPSASPE